MIKKIKIAGIVCGIIAALVLSLLIGSLVRGDKQKEEILKSPSEVEQFSAREENAKKSQEQISPLVTQAQIFGKRINPPPPPPKTDEGIKRPVPKVVAPKFKLIGTSVNPADPKKSYALLDEVGKGIHWVRKADKVGYLIIEDIKDGVVVARENDQTIEIKAERPEKMDLMSKNATGSNNISGMSRPHIDTSANKVTPQQREDAAEFMRKVATDPQSMGISPEEANQLGDLGKILKDIEQEEKQEDKPKAKPPAQKQREDDDGRGEEPP